MELQALRNSLVAPKLSQVRNNGTHLLKTASQSSIRKHSARAVRSRVRVGRPKVWHGISGVILPPPSPVRFPACFILRLHDGARLGSSPVCISHMSELQSSSISHTRFSFVCCRSFIVSGTRATSHLRTPLIPHQVLHNDGFAVIHVCHPQ